MENAAALHGWLPICICIEDIVTAEGNKREKKAAKKDMPAAPDNCPLAMQRLSATSTKFISAATTTRIPLHTSTSSKQFHNDGEGERY